MPYSAMPRPVKLIILLRKTPYTVRSLVGIIKRGDESLVGLVYVLDGQRFRANSRSKSNHKGALGQLVQDVAGEDVRGRGPLA